MRITALLPLVALLSGAAAAPLPDTVSLAPREPQFWSFGCRLFNWRCPPQRVEPVPPQPQPTRKPTPTRPPPEPTTSNTPPAPSSSDNPPEPSSSALPPGCLTPTFCPNTGGGQGGSPEAGDGSTNYPNGTRPTTGGRGRRDADADANAEAEELETREEERSTDLSAYLD
ncbi:hypothetical protein CspeluHIS016_0501050 [Cutaneotrichosporon spelunceum]|uniref:Uncharacterized protein n=1 Tax=Cutaneotrichosporon spelunceum TaxID=1672016 RepID=A0AAD3YDE1_9TREE|nr:hypothetical protein CspeluHIS016_0501050 [Cutaneotrichosporon spelunceum]